MLIIPDVLNALPHSRLLAATTGYHGALYRKFQPTDPLICISYIHAVVALYIYMIGL
jgi:hypothetical protein